MKVLARCTSRAWDSDACVLFCPGEGPHNGLYEIERDGKLASLKSGKDYVFDFDRNSPAEKHDYSCKETGCGATFKTLPELGRHANAVHRIGTENRQVEEDGTPVTLERRGRKKGRTYTCKVSGCGAILPNLYAVRVHKKTHATEATDAVAA